MIPIARKQEEVGSNKTLPQVNQGCIMNVGTMEISSKDSANNAFKKSAQ